MLRTLTILFLFIFIQVNEAREVPDHVSEILDKVAAMKNQLNDETEYERRNQHHYSESGIVDSKQLQCMKFNSIDDLSFLSSS